MKQFAACGFESYRSTRQSATCSGVRSEYLRFILAMQFVVTMAAFTGNVPTLDCLSALIAYLEEKI